MEMNDINAVWAWVLAAASAIVLISNAIEKIIKAVKAANAPNAAQDEKIRKLDERISTVEKYLSNDDTRLKLIEQEHKAVLQSLLALLDHGLDGNNIDQMKAAKKELVHSLTNHTY